MKKILLAAAALLSAAAVHAQPSSLHPAPQRALFPGDSVALPSGYRLSAGGSVQGRPALALLERLLPEAATAAGFDIRIGTRADREMKRYLGRIPERADGYYLSIDRERIVVAGADRRGTYYGVQTLAALLSHGKLPLVEITDYPDVACRGVVEGFYGVPWSHEARLDQLDFYGRNKMNIYIYGPKDDPYHRTPHWREPYPAAEAERIGRLVERAEQNEVVFYWAIHPGVDIRWTDEDRDALLRKFESMYALGVRGFAVFFDDISGEGTRADKQAALLNYIDERFVRTHEGVAPLILCPTIYNRDWMKDDGYTTTLGAQLNEGIRIMWTGDDVVTSIDRGTLDFINPQFRRKAFVWWNFPVSDYVTDHLLLGPVYGNDPSIADAVEAFVSNPMEHAEASKIALRGVADYTWNMARYDSDANWRHALRELMPRSAASLEIFAAHNSDPGPSPLKFRREESEALRPALAALTESYRETGAIDPEAYRLVAKECRRIVRAADALSTSGDENPALLREIAPWLRHFRLVGEYGEEVLRLIAQPERRERFLESYAHLKALQIKLYRVETSSNQTSHRPGVKSGSRYLMPAFEELFAAAVARYNARYGTSLDTQSAYLPYTLRSDVAQLSPLVLRREWNDIVLPLNDTPVAWQAGGALTVEIEGGDSLAAIRVDLGDADPAHFRLELRSEQTGWQVLAWEPSAERSQLRAEPGAGRWRAVRLTNVSGVDRRVRFTRFRLTRK